MRRNGGFLRNQNLDCDNDLVDLSGVRIASMLADAFIVNLDVPALLSTYDHIATPAIGDKCRVLCRRPSSVSLSTSYILSTIADCPRRSKDRWRGHNIS